MTPNRIYVVDAFTDRPFAGNPAAVFPLSADATLGETTMQRIANEMNLAETAYVTPLPEVGATDYALRWFTPTVEVDLCGHATLAAAHILWETQAVAARDMIRFHTKSGVLTAKRTAVGIGLDFPSEPPYEAPLPRLPEFLGEPVFVGRNRMDWFVVLEPGFDVRKLRPVMADVEQLGLRGLIVTASATAISPFDFVSRFFAPQSGVPEDSVTGSAHCCLGPYWSDKLGKTGLVGYQASTRGGIVRVSSNGERVLLEGQAVTTLEAMLKCI
jgi:predicted PhzF superfamily epimerase YddE/YHI9